MFWCLNQNIWKLGIRDTFFLRNSTMAICVIAAPSDSLLSFVISLLFFAQNDSLISFHMYLLPNHSHAFTLSTTCFHRWSHENSQQIIKWLVVFSALSFSTFFCIECDFVQALSRLQFRQFDADSMQVNFFFRIIREKLFPIYFIQ